MSVGTRSASTLVAGIIVGLSHVSLVFAQDNDPDCRNKAWGTYDPKPGHPTSAERQTFIDKVIPLARASEAKYGVPAAALAAMSMQESGYGWTRAALIGGAVFSFQYNSKYDKGHATFVLQCQQLASDPNNTYLKFDSYDAAFDAEARKLSTLGIYAPATNRYKVTNPKTKQAVMQWLVAVARHYNPRPNYVPDLTKKMNNPLNPSESVGDNNLYQLSVQGLTKAAHR